MSEIMNGIIELFTGGITGFVVGICVAGLVFYLVFTLVEHVQNEIKDNKNYKGEEKNE